MDLFLGIDGGGSGTRALLCDCQGNVLGEGRAGPSNIRVVSPERVRERLGTAIAGALGTAGKGRVQAAFLGLAGVANAADRAAVADIARSLPELDRSKIGSGHDLRIALAGGLAGDPGIVLVAGTGSACYGMDAKGREYQCGGWGDLVDDAGSGGWIGLRALQVCVRQADGREPETALMPTVLSSLGIDRMDEFRHRVHGSGFGRVERARMAPGIIELSVAGDPAAAAIVHEAVTALADLAAVVAGRLNQPAARVVLCGGLTQAPAFPASLDRAIRSRLPDCEPRPPCLPPVRGAVLLAMDLAGSRPEPGVISRLSETGPNADRAR